MAVIGSLAVSIVARTEKFTKGVGMAAAVVKKFETAVAGTASAVATFGAATVAAGGAVTAVMVKKQLDAVDALSKASDRLGISTEKLVGLEYAAGLYGATQDDVIGGLRDMVRRLGEAKDGGGEAAGTLNRLGLSARRLVNLQADQAFEKIADKIAALPTHAERAAAAYDLFGRKGDALLNILQRGSPEIRKLMGEADRFGLTFSRSMGAAVERANDAITRLKSALTGLFRQFTVRIAPLIETAVSKITGLLSDNNRIHTFADAITRGVGQAISFAIDALHKFQIALMKAKQIFAELAIQIATSPLAGRLGLDLGETGAYTLGRMASEGYLEARRLEEMDPAGDFSRWFNKHLDEAMRRPEAAKPAKTLIDSMSSRLVELMGKGQDAIKPIEGALGVIGSAPDQLRKAYMDNALSQLTFGLLGKRMTPVGKAVTEVKQTRFAAAVREGSREARSASLRNQFGSTKPIEKVAQHAERQVELLEEVSEKMDNLGGEIETKPWGGP